MPLGLPMCVIMSFLLLVNLSDWNVVVQLYHGGGGGERRNNAQPRRTGGMVAAQSIIRDNILKSGKYDPMVPPGNFAENVRMQIHFDVLQLVEVVESEQFIKVRLWTSLYWWDERLRWEPEDLNGVTYVYLPPTSVWTPYLFVDNSAELQYTKPWAAAEVNVSHAGRVAMKGYMVLITNCPMRVRAYPFDKQECPIMISTSDDKFQVGAELPTASFTVYTMEHSEFRVFGLKVQRGLPNTGEITDIGFDPGVITVTLTLFISRNSVQHIIALIVPCTLICVLGVTGLFVQMDPRGERMERYRFGLTAVLSLVIFQLGLYERLPVSNDGIPVLSIYYNILFAVICFATMSTSIPLMYHAKGVRGEPFPKRLEWVISFLGRPKIYKDEADEKQEQLLQQQQQEQQAAVYAQKQQQQQPSSGGKSSKVRHPFIVPQRSGSRGGGPTSPPLSLPASSSQPAAPTTMLNMNSVNSNCVPSTLWDNTSMVKPCWCMEPNGDLSYLAGGAHDYLNILSDDDAANMHGNSNGMIIGSGSGLVVGGVTELSPLTNSMLSHNNNNNRISNMPLHRPSYNSALATQPVVKPAVVVAPPSGPKRPKKTIQWIEFAMKIDDFLMYFFFICLIVTNIAAFYVWTRVELIDKDMIDPRESLSVQK